MLDSRGLQEISLDGGGMLKKVIDEMYNGQWFGEKIWWKLGNGSKIFFWEERWLG